METIALGKLSPQLPTNISREHYHGVTQFFDIYGIEYIEDLDVLKDDKSTHLTARRLPTHQPEWPQVMKLSWLIQDVILYESCEYYRQTLSITQFLMKRFKERTRETELEQAMISRNLKAEEKKEYEVLAGYEFCEKRICDEFWKGINEIRMEAVVEKRKITPRMTQREAARLIEEIKVMENMFGEVIEQEEREFIVNLLLNS